jgi:hypothetical protein
MHQGARRGRSVEHDSEVQGEVPNVTKFREPLYASRNGRPGPTMRAFSDDGYAAASETQNRVGGGWEGLGSSAEI